MLAAAQACSSNAPVLDPLTLGHAPDVVFTPTAKSGSPAPVGMVHQAEKLELHVEQFVDF